jgi:hypothetical protein
VAQQSGILGTAVNEIKTFVHLPQREQTTREWSAREWAERRQGWIFLPSREDIRDSIHLSPARRGPRTKDDQPVARRHDRRKRRHVLSQPSLDW